MGGTPGYLSHPDLEWESPVLTWNGGTPCPDLGWGTLPRPDLGWVYTLSGRMGLLPVRKDGVNPQQEGWRYPYQEGRGTYHLPHQLVGVPLMKCEQTHTCENSTFPHPSDAGGKYAKNVRFVLFRKILNGCCFLEWYTFVCLDSKSGCEKRTLLL